MDALKITYLVSIILCVSHLSQGKNDTHSLQMISLKCDIKFEDLYLKAVYLPLGSVSNVAMEYTNGTSFNDSNTWFSFNECSNVATNSITCKTMNVYDNNTYYIRLTYNNGTHMKLVGPYKPSTYRKQCVTGQPKVVLVKLLSVNSTSLVVFAKLSQDAYFTFPTEATMTLTDPNFLKQKFPCQLINKEATCVATGLEPAMEYKSCVTMFMMFFQKYTSCITSATEKGPTNEPTTTTVMTERTITSTITTNDSTSTKLPVSTATLQKRNSTTSALPEENTSASAETTSRATTILTTTTEPTTTTPEPTTTTPEPTTTTTEPTTTTTKPTTTPEPTTTTTEPTTMTTEPTTMTTEPTTTTTEPKTTTAEPTTTTTEPTTTSTPLPTEITLTLVNSSCETKSFYIYLTANFLTDHLDIAKVKMQYSKDLSAWFPISTSPQDFEDCVRQKLKTVSSITCKVASYFDISTYNIDLIYGDLSVRVVSGFVASEQSCESGSPPVSLLLSAASLSAITIDSFIPTGKKFGSKPSIVGYDDKNKSVDATKLCKSLGVANVSCTWTGLSPCKTYQFCYQSKSKAQTNYTKCSSAKTKGKTKGCFVTMSGEDDKIKGRLISLYVFCAVAVASLIAVVSVLIGRHRKNQRATGNVRKHGSYEDLGSTQQLHVEYRADDERLTLIS